MQTVASLLLMSDPHDIGMVAQVRSPHADKPVVYLYDSVPGGVGLAARLYERHAELVSGALGLVAACRCAEGCPACVGPRIEGNGLAKAWSLRLLRTLVADSAAKAA
jgi:DEAD/DEAH box helicase domain-containing protein